MKIVQLEVVNGRKVRDRDGKTAGHLHEVHADWRGDECVVTHYVLASKHGRSAMSLSHFLMLILQLLGSDKSKGTIVVPWDRMDWTDVENPRLNCAVEDLATE